MKRAIFLIFKIFLGLILQAQENRVSTQFNYLGGSAEAATKQGIVNNDLSTGRVSISFNLLSKKIGDQDISVAINYQGGGIKALDQPSEIGHGWGLTAGGLIVRQRRGVPDDFKNKNESSSMAKTLNGLLYSDPVKQSGDGDFRISQDDPAYHYNSGSRDSQHDIFNFSVLGNSGKFYIGKDKSVQIVGQNDIKIIPKFGDKQDIYTTIIAFEVINSKGVRFYFEEFQLSEDKGLFQSAWDEWTYKNKNYISAWYLSKIEFPDRNSNVIFSYGSQKPTSMFSKVLMESISERSDEPGKGRVSSSYMYDNNITRSVYLKEILFSDSSRILIDYNGYPFQNRMLKNIELRDADGRNTLKYEFNYLWWDWTGKEVYYSVFEDSEPFSITQIDDWYLESITSISEDGTRRPFYSFSYYLGEDANYSEILNKKNVDYWGYYNNADNSQNLIPYELKFLSLNSWSTRPAANRNPDFNNAQIGVLKDIYLSTGGRQSIEYELNDRFFNGTKEIIGGLRVKQISTYADDSKIKAIKQYKYIKADGNSSGFLGDKGEYKYVENIYHDNGGWPSNPSLKRTRTTYVSHALNDASFINGSHIAYARVEEHLFSEGTSYQGKTVYEFSGLDSVKNSLWFPQDYFPYRPVDRPSWAVGLPVSEAIYDSNNVLVKKIARKFLIKQNTLINENFRSLYVSSAGEVDVQNGSNGQLRYIYKHRNYYPVLGYSLISEINESYNTPGKTLNKKRVFTYDPTTGIVKTILNSSGGQDILTRYYYPFEYLPSVSTALSQMITKNMINFPILKEEWRGVTGGSYNLSSASFRNYKVDSGFPRVDKEYISEINNLIPVDAPNLYSNNILMPTAYNFKLERSFIKYSEDGIPLQVNSANGDSQSFVVNRYGVQILSVDNAVYNAVRYYGFEAHEKAFSSGTLNGQIKPNSTLMGQNSFSGTATFTGLPQGNYIVECFAKGTGNITANGSNTALTANWKNFRWKLSNINTVILTVSNVSLVDEIRIYPIGAMSAVFSSDILGNRISNIKPNGLGYFFQYDNFNRVKNILDDSGNLLETYKYNDRPIYLNTVKSQQYNNYGCPSGYVPSGPVTYTIPAGRYSSLVSQAVADQKASLAARYNGIKYANSFPNCIKGYWNVEQIQYFTKSNCLSGTKGETVAYRIPAGKYVSTTSQADADNKAIQDINQNGQNYANTNGKCFDYIQVLFSNETSQGFEVVYSGPDGEAVKDISMDTWITIINDDSNYSFYIRPKGTPDAGEQFEFTSSQGQTQIGTSATFTVKVGLNMSFTIRQIN